MKQCTAALGSLTYAIKAHRALSQSGIPCEIVKLDASMTRRGCAYGIEFSCSDHRSVRTVMSNEQITVSRYINGSGGELI